MRKDIKRQMIKIARYYYVEGMTQEQIAIRMALSRQKVGRLIKKLIPEGIIEINIDDSMDTYINFEQQLEKKFNLKEVIVVSTQDTNHGTLNALGRAAAQYLHRIVKPNDTIGVAWGRTLTCVCQHIVKERSNLNLSVVQLAGGISPNGDFFDGNASRQCEEITKEISLKLGARPYFMHSPLIVEDGQVKRALIKEPKISKAFQKIGKCDIAMTSLASLGKSVTPFIEGILGEEELKHLIKKRAVGNFLFRYFDIDGKLIQAPFYERLMCPELSTMKKIPVKICVSGTREKINAIYGGIRAGLVDVLITDIDTARTLLKKHKMYEGGR